MKRSASPLDAAPLAFFFDNCLSKKIAEALRCVGIDVVHLQDAGFSPDTKDEIWLLRVDKKRIVVTMDMRILSRPHEVAALRQSGLRVFFLPKSAANKIGLEQLAWLAHVWPEIEKTARVAHPGECYEVRENGKTVKASIK